MAKQNIKNKNKFVLFATIGVISLIFILILVLIFSGNTSNQTTGSFKGNINIQGETVPQLPQSFDRNCIFHSITLCQNFESAANTIIPDIEGVSISGEPFKIKNDGRKKIILFLAHWCPHCQVEVEIFTSWAETRGLPKDFDIYTIATANNSSQENYPPQTWLNEANWQFPTIIDTDSDNIAKIFGVTSFPYWVLVDSDNKILTRLSGTFKEEDIDVIISKILELQ
ncbi:MAG: hypothetical protein CL764_05730 [Chloroflexi bacterium]|nr:hypothetical protein [Chloroflexota bacterium]|tara:strand:+ start:786 stop:1463 length:678 start_codon:yes stop_codon:yes gene_type:complete